LLKKAQIEIRKKEEELNHNDLNGTFDNGENQFNIVENNDNNITFIEKSNINLDLDLSKKLASYMEFSMVLNRKDETNINDLSVSAIRTNDNIFSIMKGNHERNIFNVSCIEKN
jgi:hypothetical protein